MFGTTIDHLFEDEANLEVFLPKDYMELLFAVSCWYMIVIVHLVLAYRDSRYFMEVLWKIACSVMLERGYWYPELGADAIDPFQIMM